MSEGLEKLQEIGSEKIHEKTHITQRYIQAILHESFDGIAKVQLMGFISILEREYQVDLSDVRKNAEVFFEEEALTSSKPLAEYKKELLGSSSRRDMQKLIIIAGSAVVALLVAGVAFYFLNSKPTQAVPNEMNASVAKKENVEQNTSTIEEDENTSLLNEEVTPKKEEKVVEPKKEKVVQKSLRIIPRTKVWMGYIDLETDKKKQTVTSKAVTLDPNKEYLLTFGHGYIDIEVNGELKEFKEAKSIKFLYKNGVLEKIDNDQFRSYNKGKLW
jgi:hypothetical protein